MAIADIKGNRYNKLVALEFSHSHQKNAYWKFQCDCGQVTTLAAHSVKRGDSKSCGCLRKQVSTELNTKHGQTRQNAEYNRLYRIWSQMKRRCYLDTVKAYPRYGGRGIRVCDQWLDDFEAFKAWALSNGYKAHLTIDRRDNDGHYTPENCRWVTYKKQANNRSTNRMVIYRGEPVTLASLSDMSGIPQGTLAYRLDNGWSPDEAASTPVRQFVKLA